MDNTELSKDLAACVEALSVEVTECCGRRECGGECGNEWRGMKPCVSAYIAAFYFLRTHAPAIAELQARCEAAAQDLRLIACDLELLRPNDALSVDGRKAYAEKIQGIAQSLQKWPPVEDAAIDAIREAGDSDGES